MTVPQFNGCHRSRLHSIEQSVRDDIALLKAEPLLSDEINVIGYVLNLENGLLEEVRL